MDLATARFLTSPEGVRLLERARALRGVAIHRRASALRGEAPGTNVRAALAQDDLRRRAATRCPHAERLLFTTDALEQSTAWPVAVERAGRWPAPAEAPLHDLGAGIGMDALATAEGGRPVVAWERDEVRAHLLRHNADALGLSTRLRVRAENVLAARPRGRLAFLDPDRRPGGRRTRRPDRFEPPAARWPALLDGFTAAMVKLPPVAPARPPGANAAGASLEVVSLHGRARERRLLLGTLRADAPRRALSLPAGTSVSGTGRPWPEARAAREGDWLLDPDPAVTLAGLVGDLAHERGLRPVHPRIAYLVGPAPDDGAPGRWVKVEALLPPRPGVLNAYLRDRGIGQVTVRTRGVGDDAATWRRRLRPHGERAGTLLFTRDVRDRWVCLAGREAEEMDASTR